MSVFVYVFPFVSPSLYTYFPVYISPYICALREYVPLCVRLSLFKFCPIVPLYIYPSFCTSFSVYVFSYVSLFLYTSLLLYIFISIYIFVLSPCVYLLRVYILLYSCFISLFTSSPRLCPSICLFFYVYFFLCVCLIGYTFCCE